MSTTFSSVQEAKRVVAGFAGVDPDTTVFEEDPDLKVSGPFGDGPMGPNPSEEEVARARAEAEARRAAQHGFRFRNCNGVEAKIVIEPFRGGFCCWAVLDNGMTWRP